MNKSIKCTIFFIALLSWSVSYSQDDMLRPIVQNFMILNNGKFQKEKTSAFFDTIVLDMKNRHFKLGKCFFLNEFAVDEETGVCFRSRFETRLEKLFEEIEGHSQSPSKIDSLFVMFKTKGNVDKEELPSLLSLYQVPRKYILSQEENECFLWAYEHNCVRTHKEAKKVRSKIKKGCKMHRKFFYVVSFTRPIVYENYMISCVYLRHEIYRWVSYYLIYDKNSDKIHVTYRYEREYPI